MFSNRRDPFPVSSSALLAARRRCFRARRPSRGPCRPAAAMAASMAPRLEASLPGPLPLFPPTNWWNTEITAAPVDPGSAAFIAYINAGGVKHLHPDFGGTLADGVSIYGFPYAVVDGSQAKKAVTFAEPEESDGVLHPGDTSYPVLPDTRRGHHPAALDRGRGAGQRRQHRDPGPPPPRRGSRQPSPLRALQRPLGRLGLAGILRRVLRPEDERPAPRGLDLGRRGRSRDPAGPRALRRGLRPGGDPPCAPIHRAAHQRVRISRLAPGGAPGPRRASDGRAAAPEGGEGHLRFRAGASEDLPRDEDLRPDRRGQRHRHVHQRHVGRPVGQRRPESRLRRADRHRLRGRPDRLAAPARAGAGRRRARRRSFESERPLRAGRIRRRRAVVGQPRRGRRPSVGRGIGVHGARRGDVRPRRRVRRVRGPRPGRDGRLPCRDRRLLPDDGAESRRAAGHALGRDVPRNRQRNRGQALDPSPRRQLRRRDARASVLRESRDPAPQRRHRGLQRGQPSARTRRSRARRWRSSF